jgi:Winged helix-turn helix
MAVSLRGDFDASRLRGLAKKAKDGPQARRFLALAAIYDGSTRTEAAKIGGVGLQIIRDWVLRFNARGPDGLLQGAGAALQAQRRAAPGDRADDRERSDPGDPRRGPLAADRSGAVDIRGVPHHDRQADAQPGAARHGLP